MRIWLALDNLRSAYNVGSILRTSLGFDIAGVVTIGITPHGPVPDDARLPHVVAKAQRSIEKTALGGEKLLKQHFVDHQAFVEWASSQHIPVVALEKMESSEDIRDFTPPPELILVLGNEIDGVSPSILERAQTTIQIDMPGPKESFNVAVSGAIALFELTNRSEQA